MKFKVAFPFTLCVTVLALMVSASALAQEVQLFVTSHSAGKILVLNSSLTQTATVSLPSGADPIGIAINATGTLAAVTGFTANKVYFVDLTVSPPAVSGSSVSTTSAGNSAFPEDVVFSPNGACVATSDGRPFTPGDGIVTSINVANRTLVSFLTNLESEAIEFIPNNSNNLVLAADLQEDKIHVLTMGSDCSLTNTGTVAMPAGSHPRNISAFAGGQLALTSNSDGTVSVLSISGSTVTLLTTFSLPGANPGGISTSPVQSILLHPNGTLAYAFQCKVGNIELLAIDASNNVTDSGSGIAVSPSACFFGEQMATDGLNLFLATNPFKTPTNTVSGITSIDLLNNKIIGGVTITDPEGIAILAGPAQLVSNLIAAVQGMNIAGQGTSLTDQLQQVLTDINTNNGLACQDLTAFANHVQAQDGNKITTSQASQILAAVANIAVALNCGP